MTFSIELLPAQRGDCLWITYGTASKSRHLLIDAGPRNVRKELIPELEDRIRALPKGPDRVELLVVTHVDSDHIEGMVPLLTGEQRMPLFRDVWFNGYQHISGALGARQGEMVTEALLEDPRRWNAAFAGGAVHRPDEGPLPRVRLRDGLELIVLAPGDEALRALAPLWEKTCEDSGIVPGKGAKPTASLRGGGMLGLDIDRLSNTPFKDDPSKPNATSICLVASYRGKNLLLLGDAPEREIIAGLDRLAEYGSLLVGGKRATPSPTGARKPGDVHTFAAVKVSHHGSRNNTSHPMLERIRSQYWLVSSNGATYEHPDAETLARIVKTQNDPVLVFNYVSPFSKPWIMAANRPDAGFAVQYPQHGDGIIHRIA